MQEIGKTFKKIFPFRLQLQKSYSVAHMTRLLNYALQIHQLAGIYIDSKMCVKEYQSETLKNHLH